MSEVKLEKYTAMAGATINMLKHVYTTEKGIDIQRALFMASALAGYACHKAVKDLGGNFVKVETKSGKNYYFGDDVNHYLLESSTSVFGFVNAVTKISVEEVQAVVSAVASSIGNEDYKIWGGAPLDFAYNEAKSCFEGIYENMTAKVCESPSEWPIYFGIVLQNIILDALKAGAPTKEVAIMAMECALIVSKMDEDSI